MNERAMKNAKMMLEGVHDSMSMELERWNEIGHDLIINCENDRAMWVAVSHLVQATEAIRMAREELVLRGQLSS